MINEKHIENIRKYGAGRGDGERRKKVLFDEIGLPANSPAEYVIIGGCSKEVMPGIMRDLKNVLDHLKVSYTLLEKEYCCGEGTIGFDVIKTRNKDDIAAYKEISREFIAGNISNAKKLGAKAVVLFCPACEPHYSNHINVAEKMGISVISINELIDRHFTGAMLNKSIDFYAGCYGFRRHFTDKPVDFEASVRILKKINGLEVNYLDNNLCCNKPANLEQLVKSVKSKTMVHICTGCYYKLKVQLRRIDGMQTKMLPELVWEALQNK